jgi:hypothetical protein
MIATKRQLIARHLPSNCGFFIVYVRGSMARFSKGWQAVFGTG